MSNLSDSDDLDDELLALTRRSRAAPKKRGRQASESEDDGTPEAHPATQRDLGAAKRSKKAAVESLEEEEAVLDKDNLLSSLPADERARLLAMNELEREMVLYEMWEQMVRQRDRQRLLDQSRQQEQKLEVRASSRRARNQTHAEGAIGKLAAARQKQEARQQRREREKVKDKRGKKRTEELDDDEKLFEESEEFEDDAGGGSEEELLEEEEEEEKSSEGEELEPEEELQELGREGLSGDEAEKEEERLPADWREVGCIQLKRELLEKWHDEPFFADAVKGCVVRIAVGTYRDGERDMPNYQLMRVVEVVQRNSYSFGKPGKRTDKWLRLEDSGVSKAMQMSTISNTEVREEEFLRYRRHCERCNVPPISKGEVASIGKQLEAARTYKYKPEDIRRRVEQNRAKGVVVGGLAQELTRLGRELERAQMEGDEDKATTLKREMEELERKMDARYALAGAAGALAKVNLRNRHANNQKALKGISNKVVGISGEADAGVDVFSRRHTTSQVYWKTRRDGQGSPEKATAAADVAAAAAGQAAAAAAAAQQLRRTSSSAADTRKVQAHQVNMDPIQLVKELPFDVDLTRLSGSMALVRRLLGPRWQLPDCTAEVGGREVLTLADWKQRMNVGELADA